MNNFNNYPVHTLPVSLRETVQEVESATKAPVELVAASMLSSLSLLAQISVDVERPTDGKALPTSLFMVTLAESGERKTACDFYFQRKIHQWEEAMLRTYESELSEYQRKHEIWQVKKKALVKQIGKPIADPEEEATLATKLEAHTANQPVKPRKRQLLSSDITPEALIKRLHDGYPVGGLFSNEGGAILSARSMRNQPQLNSLWDGQTVKCERKGEPDIVLRDARLSIGLMVQPETFQKFLENAGAQARDNGFLARCLFTRVVSTQGLRMEQMQDKGVLSHWQNFAEKQDACLRRVFPDDPNISQARTTLKLSRDACNLWYQNFNNVEVNLAPGGVLSDIKDAASKAMDNALRIAAIFHYWEGSGDEICYDHLWGAIALMTWHINQFKFLFGKTPPIQTAIQDVIDLKIWFQDWCRKTGQRVILQSAFKQYGPNHLRKGSRIEHAICCLTVTGQVTRHVFQKKQYVQLNDFT